MPAPELTETLTQYIVVGLGWIATLVFESWSTASVTPHPSLYLEAGLSPRRRIGAIHYGGLLSLQLYLRLCPHLYLRLCLGFLFSPLSTTLLRICLPLYLQLYLRVLSSPSTLTSTLGLRLCPQLC